MGVARMVGHITYLSAESLGDKFGRRLQFADDIRYTLHRARVRDRELPAPPGRRVREALRRQHLSLHVARADLLRPRPPVRRRLAGRGAARRGGAHAADRVQLRLAVSAGRLRGAGAGAARARQGRRAARDRRALRPRLLPARGGAPDADDPAVLARASARPGDRSIDGTHRRPEGLARLRLRHPTGARRAAARPEHRRARRADLPDHQLRVRGSGVGRRLLQPAGVRQHLLADHEPDRRRVRGAHGQPRRRLRRRRLRQRHRGAGGGAVHAAAAGRSRRLVVGALRRHRQPVQAPAAQDERRPDAGSIRTIRTPGAPPSATNTKAFYGETIGNPGGNVLDIETRRGDRARAPAAADRRQHLRDAVPVPADRVGRRHRRCTRRPSSSAATAPASAAWSSTPGTFNWSNGRFPVDRRAVAGVPRPAASTRRSAPTAT